MNKQAYFDRGAALAADGAERPQGASWQALAMQQGYDAAKAAAAPAPVVCPECKSPVSTPNTFGMYRCFGEHKNGLSLAFDASVEEEEDAQVSEIDLTGFPLVDYGPFEPLPDGLATTPAPTPQAAIAEPVKASQGYAKKPARKPSPLLMAILQRAGVPCHKAVAQA